MHICHECCGIFESEHALNSHKRDSGHHQRGNQTTTSFQKRYHCSLGGCNRIFDDLRKYNHHQRDCHLKPFRCTRCGKGHSSKRDLKVHERIHRKLRPEKCTFCAQTFSDPAALRKHKKYVHDGTAEIKPFVCRSCRKCFARKESLKKHYHRVHDRNGAISGQLPFKTRSSNLDTNGLYRCKSCGLGFETGKALGGHRKVHIMDIKSGKIQHDKKCCTVDFHSDEQSISASATTIVI